MPTRRRLLLAALSGALAPALRAADEDFGVFTDAPRLLLRPQRLRLLRRERERQSMRWQQFSAIVTGKAPLAEPGFALALYYQVSGDKAAGMRAIEWAASATDIRQIALVYDWCQPLLEGRQKEQIEDKLLRSLRTPAANEFFAMRTRAFAAIAVADKLPDHGAAILGDLVTKWWRGTVAPSWNSGRELVRKENFIHLYELLHAVRDNLNIDLRENAVKSFRELPTYFVVSDYPAIFPGGENDFRIPAAKDAQPDLTRAAHSRAAGLSMVAYDTNALESQFLQGWLMQDNFAMRGGLGSPYEFLWANPYQPGLSYHHMPLLWHDPQTGRLFARSSWDEEATLIGFFDRQMQWFEDGRIRAFKPSIKPQQVGPATFLAVTAPAKFDVDEEEPATLFLMGLDPRTAYDVEIDDEEMSEEWSDAGGVLALHFPSPIKAGVRLKKSLFANGAAR
ncbi:MAG: hypothetical protein ABI823_09175 [Bryobacteraceae bacterium]